ncbi:MAG: CCA tRNA nucleotidyltransferase [Clostridiales bacterium]|nr:CCA tRNA nucleotidyltransferase [Candidatus Cacconaster stercorequi]
MLPKSVSEVLQHLEETGHQAYAVGGCVRDLLLGRQPDDWDMTTSALPEETMALFAGHAIPTGLQHGTVTVRWKETSFEVTTFRADGPYADNRHPSAVFFSTKLSEDLKRRDFTVNAMALSSSGELTDLFGGQADLKAGIIRCVGDPDARFREDALRIMRALRFASVLGFSIAPETAAAIRRNRELLRHIAVERIRVEMDKLLCGQHAASVLRQFPEVIGVFLPELTAMVGFDQRNFHHCYDLWEHTLHALKSVQAQPVLRWTMLLHDVGKVECFTVDGGGVGHFYGHDQRGAVVAETICRRLRFDKRRLQRITLLIGWHDRDIPRTKKGLRRALYQLGEEALRQLCEVKRADNMAQHPDFRWVQREIDRAEEILDELLAQENCFSLRQLAVGGRDMIALGLRGGAIGAMLNSLLEQVVDGNVPNEREALLDWVKKRI